MFYNAQNGTIDIEDTYMDYISFGSGDKVLIMIPGLGDGLKTVKGMALPFAQLYKEYAGKYQVFVFSRKNKLPAQYNSRDMAKDQMKALQKLGITKADFLGVSQGGTIAQYLAIDYPELVNKLVLAVTYARPNDTAQEVVSKWISCAEAGQYTELFIDIAEKTYSEQYLKNYRKFYPLLSKLSKPKSYDRFLVMANTCLSHCSYDKLGKIACPTLVIGGQEDKIVTAAASVELAEAVQDSELYLYEGLGHGAYEEAKDFNQRVIHFLEK